MQNFRNYQLQKHIVLINKLLILVNKNTKNY
jgi:hypothetical protein